MVRAGRSVPLSCAHARLAHRPGVHDHLAFGEGTTDFAEVFAGLRQANYVGGLHVELSRHSHDAVRTARRSLDFLRPLIGS